MAIDTPNKRRAALLGSVLPVADAGIDKADRRMMADLYLPFVSGPYCSAKRQAYAPGSKLSQVHRPGSVKAEAYMPGAVAGQGDC